MLPQPSEEPRKGGQGDGTRDEAGASPRVLGTLCFPSVFTHTQLETSHDRAQAGQQTHP